jgi:hypothetical protein
LMHGTNMKNTREGSNRSPVATFTVLFKFFFSIFFDSKETGWWGRDVSLRGIRTLGGCPLVCL